MNNKILNKTLFIFLLFLSLFNLSFAQSLPTPPEPNPSLNILGCSEGMSLRNCMLYILFNILRVILTLAIILAVLFMTWAGVIYITKGSDDKAREKANNMLIFGAVGLVIAFIAYGLVIFLTRILGSTTPNI
jgi:high-affinity K+ transport system ATPase subunit B